jgi:RNA polymerase sigma-70 factor (ECF subfamily)
LRAFALEYVKSREIAVEVVHDVFLRIWQRRERLDIRESFKAYIYRATRNRALDVVKRDALERRYVEEALLESVAGESFAPASAQKLLEQHDLAAAMERVVGEFPERRRMVFTLRWKSGLRHEEIAELMGISTKTVENQITRALRELRARLAPYL